MKEINMDWETYQIELENKYDEGWSDAIDTILCNLHPENIKAFMESNFSKGSESARIQTYIKEYVGEK